MASGITHILLMKNLQIFLPEDRLKSIVQTSSYILQVGAVGPDLPYASIADSGDYFFKTQSELADKFHYENTNQLILKAFREIKNNQNYTSKEKRFLFAFFLGFASHIVADGIIHPFVRDKVGDYQTNQTAHRVLEMQLDVLLYNHLTLSSSNPINLNYSNIHDELVNFNENFYPEIKIILQLFSDKIYAVYGERYEPETIKGWINGLYTMFDLAEGEHPIIYKGIGFINDFLFKDYEELKGKYSSILTLEKPKDREKNFMNRPKVHFFDDCLPQFYKIFVPLTKKLYMYTFEDGPEVTEDEIPLIDLDTGRLLANNNLDEVPILWNVA